MVAVSSCCELSQPFAVTRLKNPTHNGETLMFVICYIIMGMGNTVGSRESNIVFRARRNQELWVSPRQLEILAGSILGDAYVSPLGKIQLEHGIKQKEYLLWKYSELASISYPSPPMPVRHYNHRTGKLYLSVRFWTRQFFRPLRSRFYQGTMKVFPFDLSLTPLMVAIWHMDDGHYDQDKNRFTLATDNYDPTSIKRICLNFDQQWSIQPVLRKSGKLVFQGENRERFITLIKPHIIPAMN